MAESPAARLRAYPLRLAAVFPSSFLSLSRRLPLAAVTVAVLVLAGFLMAQGSDPAFPSPGAPLELTLAIWIAVLIGTELTPVRLPRGGFLTVSSAFDHAAILLFGPFATAVLDLVSGVTAHGLLRPRAPLRVLFNLATCIVAAFGASAVHRALGGTPGRLELELGSLLAFAGLGITYFAINTGLVSLVLGAESGDSPWRVWQVNYRWTLRHLVAYLPLGALIVIVHTTAGPLGLLLVLFPLFLSRHAFRLYLEMREDVVDFSAALVSVIEGVDPYTRRHSIRVAAYAERLARKLGRPEEEVRQIRLAGLLHDLGKVGQGPALLTKPSRLDPDERARMQAHPAAGAEVVAKIRAFSAVAHFVRHHHERPDGGGYPDGLRGDAIPIGSRVVLVADAFDAMTSDRPYRPGMPAERAIAELCRHAGTQFDARVVEVLARLWERGEFPIIRHEVGDFDIRQRRSAPGRPPCRPPVGPRELARSRPALAPRGRIGVWPCPDLGADPGSDLDSDLASSSPERFFRDPGTSGKEATVTIFAESRRPPAVSDPVLIGQSAVMSTAVAAAVRAAASNAPVLIEGETGTGKELLARLIHTRSRRRGRPFLSHNCGATPDSLIENELFGHARGAFTGAHRDEPGLFEAADHGTLFLDEIADVSPLMQMKLLRVLQEGEFRRVGDARSRRADVRLIAATNRPLTAEVAAGRFRADLFYRLHVVALGLPPLRERGPDLGLLIQHLVERAALAERRPPIQLTAGAFEALGRYPWPGNVRELENEIRRLTALWAGERVGVEALAERVRGALLVDRMATAGEGASGRRGGLHAAVQALERQIIAECLVRRAGNKSRVARDLGLSRQGLAKKMRRYGIGFDLVGDLHPAIAGEPRAAPSAAEARGGALASDGAIS
jgi:putative nucleotidyltransferase with HDIG domain